MGATYRKRWTAVVPAKATISKAGGKTTARWMLRNGKEVAVDAFRGKDGRWRYRGQTKAFVVKYRDAGGAWREQTSGCKDQRAAQSVLARLEARVERVKSGLLTVEEDSAAEHASTPLQEHLGQYLASLRLRGGSEARIRQVESRITRIARDCGVTRLSDLSVAKAEGWLSERQREGMAAATRNIHRGDLVGLGNWCVRTSRLLKNPFTSLPCANVKSDRRRTRRALTADELHALFAAAERRPLDEALTIRRGRRKGALEARVKPEVRQRLLLLGKGRALAYRCLFATGLRVSELKSITIGQTMLDDRSPHLVLNARDEKSRRGAQIPLRRDLVEELRSWLAERLDGLQDQARGTGEPMPTCLPMSAKLLSVPSIRVFDADAAYANLAKHDDRGRSLDLHALRHSLASHLSAAGVGLRVAQAVMRHASPVMTAVTYVDESMLNVAAAVEALPRLA